MRSLCSVFMFVYAHNYELLNASTSLLCISDYTRGLEWMIGLIPLIHSSNTAVSLFSHILQFTFKHTLVLSVFTSRILATDFNRTIIAVLL
jgi:hypothetical protein